MQIMIELACSVLMSSNNFFIIFSYIKIPEDSSDKYYQNNKEILQKNLMKYIEVFLKKKKKKSYNMVVNNSKVYQKTKNKGLLSI